MRKIIALLLALLTIFSLTACGAKTKEAEPESRPQVTEATTPAPVVDMTPHVIEGKQEFWEQVFKKSTIKTASDSFTMDMADVSVKAQKDKHGNIFVGYNCAQTTNESLPAVYINKNNKGYVRNIPNKILEKQLDANSEVSTVDTWTLLTFETEADKKELDTFLQNLQHELTPMDDLTPLIKKIEYVHTINNQDYIKAYYTEIDTEKAPALIPAEDSSVLVYGLFEFVVEEQPIQFVYLKEIINGFTFGNIRFMEMEDVSGTYNSDTNMVTFGDKQYKCTMVVDYTKKELPTIEYCLDFIMEPKTQSVRSVKGEIYNVPFAIEFTECEKAYDVMQIPFFTDNNIEFATFAKEYIDFIELDIAFKALDSLRNKKP